MGCKINKMNAILIAYFNYYLIQKASQINQKERWNNHKM